MTDYYRILGIKRDASADQIKKAFKKKALEYHPDRNKGDEKAAEKFKEAAQAYEVLNDPQKRKMYDRYGTEGIKNGGHDPKVRVEEILRDFGHIFNASRFKDFFYNQDTTPPEDLNVYLKIKIKLEESVKGVQKKIKIKHYITCSYCGGNGAEGGTSLQVCDGCQGTGQEESMEKNMFIQMFSTKPCRQCQGSGKIVYRSCKECKGEGRRKVEETITLNLPPGVTQGMQLTKTGKGHAPLHGGSPGDLIILIEEIEHDVLKRDGLNIHYRCVISLLDAINGTEVKVPTMEGDTQVKIAPTTQSGHMILLKGKGLPHINSPRTRGDQIVHIYVWTPKKLTKETKKALEKLTATGELTPPPEAIDPDFFKKMHV